MGGDCVCAIVNGPGWVSPLGSICSWLRGRLLRLALLFEGLVTWWKSGCCASYGGRCGEDNMATCGPHWLYIMCIYGVYNCVYMWICINVEVDNTVHVYPHIGGVSRFYMGIHVLRL